MSLLLWLPCTDVQIKNNGSVWIPEVEGVSGSADQSGLKGTLSFTFPNGNRVFESGHAVSMMICCSAPAVGWIMRYLGSTANGHSRGFYYNTSKQLEWAFAGSGLAILSAAQTATIFDGYWHNVTFNFYWRSEWRWEVYIDGAYANGGTGIAALPTGDTLNRFDIEATSTMHICNVKVFDEPLSPLAVVECCDNPKFNVTPCRAGVSEDWSGNNCQIAQSSGKVEGALFRRVVHYHPSYPSSNWYEFSFSANIHILNNLASNAVWPIYHPADYPFEIKICVNTNGKGVVVEIGSSGTTYTYSPVLAIGLHSVGFTFKNGVGQIWVDGVAVTTTKTGTGSTYIGWFDYSDCGTSQYNYTSNGSETNFTKDTFTGFSIGGPVSRVKVWWYKVPDAVMRLNAVNHGASIGIAISKPQTLVTGNIVIGEDKIFMKEDKLGEDLLDEMGIASSTRAKNVIGQITGYWEDGVGWWYPILCQSIPNTQGPFLPSSVDITTEPWYHDSGNWSHFHLLNTTLPNNITTKLANGYQFMVLQGNFNGSFTRLKWKQAHNPIGATYAQVCRSSGNISAVSGLIDACGGIYVDPNKGDRRIIHANATNGNNHGLGQAASYNGGFALCNNAVGYNNCVQILCVGVGMKSDSILSEGRLWKDGTIDFAQMIEV